MEEVIRLIVHVFKLLAAILFINLRTPNSLKQCLPNLNGVVGSNFVLRGPSKLILVMDWVGGGQDCCHLYGHYFQAFIRSSSFAFFFFYCGISGLKVTTQGVIRAIIDFQLVTEHMDARDASFVLVDRQPGKGWTHYSCPVR